MADLESYLVDELKLSEQAALKRTGLMRSFVKELDGNVRHPLCRFKRWRVLGYRCTVFEKDWVFAYEIVPEGVIVRDMSHAKLLKE